MRQRRHAINPGRARPGSVSGTAPRLRRRQRIPGIGFVLFHTSTWKLHPAPQDTDNRPADYSSLRVLKRSLNPRSVLELPNPLDLRLYSGFGPLHNDRFQLQSFCRNAAIHRNLRFSHSVPPSPAVVPDPNRTNTCKLPCQQLAACRTCPAGSSLLRRLQSLLRQYSHG